MTDEETTKPEGEPAEESNRGFSKLLSTVFRPDPDVWNESRKLVTDTNLRVEDLALVTSQDPAMVLDLLKISNALFFAGGKSPITSSKTAILRMGAEQIIDTFEKMRDRPSFENPKVGHWFELHRSRCRRTAIIARLLSEVVARTLSDDCQTAGLFLNIGDLLAVAHFQDDYVDLAEDQNRSSVLYKLHQNYRFDAEAMGLAYLRRYGIPEAVVGALDREARIRNNERAIMKPLCFAAGEIIEAFDSGRWEKFSPGKTLNPKSSLRLLQIPDGAYLKIYEKASEYLFQARLQDEQKRIRPKQEFAEGGVVVNTPTAIESATPPPPQMGSDQLGDEISSLLNGQDDFEDDVEVDHPEVVVAKAKAKPIERAPVRASISIKAPPDTTDAFGLESSKTKKRDKIRAPAGQVTDIKKMTRSSLRKDVVVNLLNDIEALFDTAKTAETLLTTLLDRLTGEGLFQKTALIVVAKDKSRAIVVAARGDGIEERQIIEITDPLSPLANVFAKVQSFGARQSESSPFGSRTFALSPIDADHDSPVVLYADCGNEGFVPFEARRAFRLVVEALNKRLPEVPGGIPVDI